MLRKKIKELASILRDEDLEEIEVRTLWRTVRVTRRGAEPAGFNGQIAKDIEGKGTGGPAGPEAGRKIEPRVAETAGGGPQVHVEKGEGESSRRQILSPMVGTFYRATDPQTEPFVEVGSSVGTGQVLCIIEAMKLMNEIEAESECVIREILVEDSHPVEFGQPLFVVESA